MRFKYKGRPLEEWPYRVRVMVRLSMLLFCLFLPVILPIALLTLPIFRAFERQGMLYNGTLQLDRNTFKRI